MTGKQNEPPWDDVKVAFGIDDADRAILWEKSRAMPAGWTLVEIDGAGARNVAIFRVDGPLREEDGRRVVELLCKAGARRPPSPADVIDQRATPAPARKN